LGGTINPLTSLSVRLTTLSLIPVAS